MGAHWVISGRLLNSDLCLKGLSMQWLCCSSPARCVLLQGAAPLIAGCDMCRQEWRVEPSLDHQQSLSLTHVHASKQHRAGVFLPFFTITASARPPDHPLVYLSLVLAKSEHG